uniref:Uncharacterized protein n=1 Tax=Brassica campestris TaxID=3711 RepID=M4D9A2_BRACM
MEAALTAYLAFSEVARVLTYRVRRGMGTAWVCLGNVPDTSKENPGRHDSTGDGFGEGSRTTLFLVSSREESANSLNETEETLNEKLWLPLLNVRLVFLEIRAGGFAALKDGPIEEDPNSIDKS